jgi:hypothetical protein
MSRRSGIDDMAKRGEAMLRRLIAKLGDVRLSDALAIIIQNGTASPGAPTKWDAPRLWILYLAIEDRKERGLPVDEACRSIAIGTVHSWKTIKGCYYRARKIFDPLVGQSLPTFLCEWRAETPPI